MRKGSCLLAVFSSLLSSDWGAFLRELIADGTRLSVTMADNGQSETQVDSALPKGQR